MTETTHDISPDGTATTRTTILRGGIELPTDRYVDMQAQVNEAIPSLDFGREYKIQQLLRPEFWTPLSRTARRTLGRALAYLVSTRQVGLRFAGCNRCNSKRYLRI